MISLRDKDCELINHWYIAATSGELKNSPIRRVVYDWPIVLFRNDMGVAQALIDQCLHRGSKLSEGKCTKAAIQCPYHGWTFSGEGELINVPSEGTISENQKRNWKIRSFPLVEQDGCLWIWLGKNPPAPERPPWRFPKFSHPKYSGYFMVTDFPNEVTHLVQNFMDVPHTVFVHDKWFRKKRSIKVPVHIDVTPGRVHVEYMQPKDQIGFVASILNPGRKPMIHTDEFIFPNITQVDYQFGEHHFIINSQCTPVSRYQTRVYTWINFRLGLMTWPLNPFFRFYTRQVINQDVGIMRNQGENLRVFELNGQQWHLPAEAGFKSTGADELHSAIDLMRAHGRTQPELVAKMHYSREREFWI